MLVYGISLRFRLVYMHSEKITCIIP
jgi:hypothetical protein